MMCKKCRIRGKNGPAPFFPEKDKIYKNYLTLIDENAKINIVKKINADVAELADALVLGTSTNGVEVQVLSSAP